MQEIIHEKIRVKNVSLYFDRKLSSRASFKQSFIARTAVLDDSKPFYALSDVSFDVYDGEVLGVIGSNGAGKSTLLRLLSGIYPPDQGEIIINGKASLLALGTGFQPDLSGLDNININATLLGMPKKEIAENIESIIDFADLRPFINSPLKTYSSGMKSRLGFSIAVHINRDILLVDETLSVGDARFKEKSKRRIRELIKSQRTVILVSHSMNEIKQLCRRVLWLEKGKVIKIGPAKQVVEEYLEFTKS